MKVKERSCSSAIDGVHSWLYVGNLEGSAVYGCEFCGDLKRKTGLKTLIQRKVGR